MKETKDPVEKTDDPKNSDPKSPDSKKGEGKSGKTPPDQPREGDLDDLEEIRTTGSGVKNIVLEMHAGENGDFFCAIVGYDKEIARGQSRESIELAIGKCLDAYETGISLGFPEQPPPEPAADSRGFKPAPKPDPNAPPASAATPSGHTTRDLAGR